MLAVRARVGNFCFQDHIMDNIRYIPKKDERSVSGIEEFYEYFPGGSLAQKSIVHCMVAQGLSFRSEELKK